VDYVGTEMLNEQRAKRNMQPKSVPLLEMAAEMGLGTNDPEKMEVLKVDLGPKAVEPTDSYKTQWGNVKDRESKRP
jgi:hypothetical protein